MTPLQLCLIALGGAAGALTRYGVNAVITQRFGTTFPYGTFIINITGSFLLGLIYELAKSGLISGFTVRPLVGIGFIGAYTTFSTFEYESANLGFSLNALMNIVGSVVAGYGCVWAGIGLGASISKAFGILPK